MPGDRALASHRLSREVRGPKPTSRKRERRRGRGEGMATWRDIHAASVSLEGEGGMGITGTESRGTPSPQLSSGARARPAATGEHQRQPGKGPTGKKVELGSPGFQRHSR